MNTDQPRAILSQCWWRPPAILTDEHQASAHRHGAGTPKNEIPKRMAMNSAITVTRLVPRRLPRAVTDQWSSDQLLKNFQQRPFPQVWKLVLESLKECQTLVVLGYSFPPTDFRTKRLFLEAFNDTRSGNSSSQIPMHQTHTIRQLTHYRGPAVIWSDLQSLDGLPSSWFDDDPRLLAVRQHGRAGSLG